MAASKPLAVISGAARTHGIGRGCVEAFLQVTSLASGLQEDPQYTPSSLFRG